MLLPMALLCMFRIFLRPAAVSLFLASLIVALSLEECVGFTASSLSVLTSTTSMLRQVTNERKSKMMRAPGLAGLLLRAHSEINSNNKEDESRSMSRRKAFAKVVSSASAVTTGALSLPLLSTTRAAYAADKVVNSDETVDTVQGVDMKMFLDPQGMFAITVPKRFFVLRRSSKGDLPDEKTGAGRRGSSIFSAGDMAKAEVIAVERFPTRVLLEENGIEATGDLKTIPDIGEPPAVANLIALRRDRDKPGISNTKIIPDSLLISADGRELSFQLKTEIEVQKPELLLEQYGVAELYRITAAKMSLRSNDGNCMAVFASALAQDFAGPDGAALQASVNSFQAIDRANTWPLTADNFVMLDAKQK